MPNQPSCINCQCSLNYSSGANEVQQIERPSQPQPLHYCGLIDVQDKIYLLFYVLVRFELQIMHK
ncbi:hypothetical protein BDN70DRAFT_879291 [Pholiota conissans]|uniref:Uncharacterized protein n=1 Tax=Pholiota conissans TaxID=109636 RepID=A0A9P5Z077_9AGAR|nr:hypothetical protein BDN70DRAFT_879291 [Pholiota conissans]